MNKEEYDRMPLANKKVYDLIADKAGGVKSRFAALINVTPQVIGRIFKPDKRNNKYPSVSDDIKNGIKSAFGFDDMWFVTESNEVSSTQVPMQEAGEEFTQTSKGLKYFKIGKTLYMETTLVPFSAYGRYANEADKLEPDREEWEKVTFEVPIVGHGNYLAFEVKGESMDDGTRGSFEEGDIVLVRELERELWEGRLRFNDYPYWVVVFDSSVLIKQLIKHDEETGDLTFHSLNPSPEYADFSINMDKIRKLFYVIKKRPKDVEF